MDTMNNNNDTDWDIDDASLDALLYDDNDNCDGVYQTPGTNRAGASACATTTYHIFDGDCYQGVERDRNDAILSVVDDCEVERYRSRGFSDPYIVEIFLGSRHDNVSIFATDNNFVVGDDPSPEDFFGNDDSPKPGVELVY